MVMETPSPQCVGLEFVRQYYTVLNKAPMHLHRFYSHNSLFMHGGPNSVNDPTVGQADIHKKIISLNFQDCHAKIRMVDAHATLGEGVVIQVTGELSNNGMPMRRFMQTFVLAPQSPKKYYVHNDIFRYQDEVFCEEEPVEEGNSEPEDEELDTQSPCAVENTTYPINSSTINGTAHHNHHEPELCPPIPAPSIVTSTAAHISSPPQPEATPPPVSTPAPTIPTVQIPASPPAVAPTPVVNEPPRPTTPPAEEADGWGTPAPSSDEWADPIEEVVTKTPTPIKKESKPSPPAQPELPQPTPAATPSIANEPKTFANLFKNSSNFPPSLSTTTPQASQVHPEPTVVPQPSFSAQPPRTESTNNRSSGLTSGPPPGSTQSSGPSTGNLRPTRNFYDDDKRRPPVPDSQQVFVGNLPHSIGEDQLKTEFTQYGKILEVRINTGKGKSGAKGPGGHTVPNFGFIAFDDESSVARCLSARPIYLNNESRINVEEKKARSRMDSMGNNSGMRPNSGRGSLGGENDSRGGIRGGGRGGMNQGRDLRGGGGRGNYSSRGDSNRGGPGGSRGGGFMPRR